ncbi:Predicted dehydrogenase [bacterium A37T11]|nr:Predicted dehydrogenase [bacterium A37T11]
MSVSKPIITGILSYGMSGRVFHAPLTDSNKHFTLRAVTERTKKKAQERYPNIISYNSVDELINDPKIELVIVNTPNDTHVDYTKKALLAGKHVLVEKPCAPTSAEAKELFELAEQQQKHLMVFHNRRWDSDFRIVQRVLNTGVLGNIIEFHVRFDRYRKEKGPKLFKEIPIPASGVTYDLASHLLDQVICLFGKPDKSIKINTINREGSEVDDFGSLILSYHPGPTVYVTTSLLVAQPLPAYVIHGTKGSFQKSRADVQETQLDQEMLPTQDGYGIEPAGQEGLLTIIHDNNRKELKFREGLKGNYAGLFQAVYEQIRKNEPYPIKPDQIIWQLEILEQKNWNNL